MFPIQIYLPHNPQWIVSLTKTISTRFASSCKCKCPCRSPCQCPCTPCPCNCWYKPCKCDERINEIVYYPQNFLDKLLNRKRIRKRPARECCRLARARSNPECEKIPEFITEMVNCTPGSRVYKTEGQAYVMEVPKTLPSTEKIKPPQVDILMKKIQTEHLKQGESKDLGNPMPDHIENHCVRMMELNARKLHPLYKKYEHVKLEKRKYYDYSKHDILIKPIKHPMELLKGSFEIHPKKRVFIDYTPGCVPVQTSVIANPCCGMDIKINTRIACQEEAKLGLDCIQPKGPAGAN